MDNVRRELETLRKFQTNARNKNTVTETKNSFEGLISILGRDEERSSELQSCVNRNFPN